MKPSQLGDIFSTEWTRDALHEVTQKAKIHLTQVSVSCSRALLLYLTIPLESEDLGVGKRLVDGDIVEHTARRKVVHAILFPASQV